MKKKTFKSFSPIKYTRKILSNDKKNMRVSHGNVSNFKEVR